jgi:hypothetical protein
MATAAPKTAAMSNADIVAYARANYGYLAAFLSMKEVGPILLKAARLNYDSNKLLGLLAPTHWWKTTTASARTFDAEAKLDPATNARKVANMSATIGAQATKDGLHLSAATLKQISTNSLRLGWTSDQISQALGHQFHYNPQQQQQAPVVDQIKKMADQYLVPLSNHDIQKWGSQIIGGQVDADNLEGYLKEQAKSLFPGMNTAIDSGVTPKQYVAPYASIASSTLEIPPESVDFMNPKWGKALFQVDPKTGARTSMSLSDWQNTLRTDPTYGFDKTQQARATGADLITSMQKTFGA